MKAILEFFSSSWLDLVGYSLLHSLWQGLLITIIVAVFLRALPTRYSNFRYTIATGGLFSIVICSIITISYLSSAPADVNFFSGHHEVVNSFSSTIDKPSVSLTPFLVEARNYIEKCMPIFLMIWAGGALTFVMRIFMGLAYVNRLREGSLPLGDDWNSYIQKIAARLKIDRLITLAQSPAIDAPMVIGYVKPFILIPVGLCSSLSTAQLETIFIHELMHIRRKDYLVNLVQSFVEAIYFFNPFVWSISNMVKSEREHCCDDAVVELHGNTTAFASALAALEEARLSNALSLSLTGSKNELLKRIKRLMEKSAQHHYASGKVIPAALLIIGLVCASWISTSTSPSESDAAYIHNATMVQDTTKKNKKARAKDKAQKNRTSDQKIEVPVDKNVNVDNDVELEEHVAKEIDEDFSYAHPLPDFDLPPIPDVANVMPPLEDLDIMMQDFEPPHIEWNDKDWEKFSKEFEEKFKAAFGDFYEKNESGIQKIMGEIQENLNNQFGDDFKSKMEDFAKQQQEWAKANAERWEQHGEKMALHSEGFEKMGEEMRKLGESFHEEFEKNHREFEKQHKEFEERSRNFENALREELEKDGYLDKGEKLEAIQFNNDGLKINGEPIKAEHQGKYNELRKTYFGNGGFIKTE